MKQYIKHAVIAVVLTVVLYGTTEAYAQRIMVSQKAMVMQRIKTTDVTVEYHRPLVRNREVYGNMVPYGQPWRGGANNATLIEFSKDVTIDGNTLAAGVYGFWVVPNPDEWELIISKARYVWGIPYPGQQHEIFRVKAKPQGLHHTEELSYYFKNVKATTADLILHWEKVGVALPITVK